jgi:hypothetical protein
MYVHISHSQKLLADSGETWCGMSTHFVSVCDVFPVDMGVIKCGVVTVRNFRQSITLRNTQTSGRAKLIYLNRVLKMLVAFVALYYK